MRGMVVSIGNRSGLLAPVLALLLLFRLLVPSGYMIAPDRDGRPGLALCSMPAQPSSPQSIGGGHEGHGEDPAAPAPGERPCPYAALTAPPLPPAPPAVPAHPAAAALPPDLPPAPGLPRVAAAAPPPPATGPPAAV